MTVVILRAAAAPPEAVRSPSMLKRPKTPIIIVIIIIIIIIIIQKPSISRSWRAVVLRCLVSFRADISLFIRLPRLSADYSTPLFSVRLIVLRGSPRPSMSAPAATRPLSITGMPADDRDKLLVHLRLRTISLPADAGDLLGSYLQPLGALPSGSEGRLFSRPRVFWGRRSAGHPDHIPRSADPLWV